MKLLIAGAFPVTPEQQAELEHLGYEIIRAEREDGELPEKAEEAEAAICNWLFVHHPAERFKKLRLVQLLSAGYDRVPVSFFRERGVLLYNARGVYSIPMAEFAVSGVLQLYKRSAYFSALRKTASWQKSRDLLELCGRRVGIIGAGSIGTECAKRFRAFTDHVIGVDITVRDDAEAQQYYERIYPFEQLDALLPELDIVVLTIPLTDETRNLFDSERLARMKEQSVLVNIARGGIVDEEALAEALDTRLFGAVFDVFSQEPLPADHILWEKENLLITPHNSFVSANNHERMWKIALANLREYAEAQIHGNHHQKGTEE